MKPWYQSKTILANAVPVVLAVGDQLAGAGALAALGPWALPAWAIANIVLRATTSQPIGSK